MKRLFFILLLSMCAALPAAAQRIDLSRTQGTLPCARMPALTGSVTTSAGSCVTTGVSPVLDCSKFAGAEDGAKIQACMAALYAISPLNGVADARGMTGGSWAVNPFDATNIPAAGRLLVGPGTISVLYGPLVSQGEWSIEGTSTRNVDAILGSVLKAGALFPKKYTTGTVTVGTAGNNDIITGVGTAWADNYVTHTGTDIAAGCSFVAPAGGNTANATFGIIKPGGVTDATHITLKHGVTVGTGAPAGSTYTIFCPVYQFSDGGTNAAGDMFGRSLVNVGLDANGLDGVIPAINWFGEQNSFMDNVSLRNYCGTGFLMENEFQYSGPWRNITSSPSASCQVAGTMTLIVRGSAQPFFGFSGFTAGGLTGMTRMIDLEGSYITMDGVDVETVPGSSSIGISIGGGPACNPACAKPGLYSAVTTLRNITGSGGTLIDVSSTNGSDSNNFSSLSGNNYTNILNDHVSGCLHTTAQANRLSSYITGQSGVITSSSSVSPSCQERLKTLTVATLPAAASNSGVMLTVSDSTTISAEGQTCVGGGAVKAMAFSNGSVWKCF